LYAIFYLHITTEISGLPASLATNFERCNGS
jgi:hypothetical protein